MIDAATSLYCLIGDPVQGSLSPSIHNAAFEALHLNSLYLAFPVRSAELEQVVRGLSGLGVAGFNVTIPHKVPILALLDELSVSAELVGAVNTVVSRSRRLVGHNTDIDGVLATLRKHEVQVKGTRCVVFGAGGFARGAAGALTLAECAEITLVCRDVAKGSQVADELSNSLRREVHVLPLNNEELEEVLRDAEILINATPVGMHPEENVSPIPSELLSHQMVVLDAVYEPRHTKLLMDAKKAGAKPISGLHILLEQAAAAFRIWTGREPPMEAMREAVSDGPEVLA